MSSTFRVAVVLSAFSLLAGCGSDKPPIVTPQDPPVLTVTSHAAGDRIYGGRSVTLSGTLSSPTAVTAVVVRLNGAEVAGCSFTQTGFTAPLELGNRTNAVEVAATNAAGKTATASLSLEYPFVVFNTFQPASLVIGQDDFTSRTMRPIGANTFGSLYGMPTVHAGRLYIPDRGRHRVLGFDPVPTANGATASFVLGQPDFTSTGGTPSATVMSSPYATFVHDGKLFVVERYAHRITVFDPVPSSTQPTASLVIGQPDLDTSTSACTASKLTAPTAALVVGTKLVVADGENHRVLIWNTVPTANGTPADLVLGQVDFTHCIGDDENGDGVADATPSARTLDLPSGIWSDGTRLVVAEYYNNRVLIWNTFPTTNQAPADVVLGQSEMTTSVVASGAAGINSPRSVTSNGNQLILADVSNNRILIWNSFPTVNGQPADLVLGQGDLDHSAANDDDQDGASDLATTARTLSSPQGLSLDGTRLYVLDNGNYRVLAFDGT